MFGGYILLWVWDGLFPKKTFLKIISALLITLRSEPIMVLQGMTVRVPIYGKKDTILTWLIPVIFMVVRQILRLIRRRFQIQVLPGNLQGLLIWVLKVVSLTISLI